MTFELDFGGTTSSGHCRLPLEDFAEIDGPPEDQRAYPRPEAAGAIQLRLVLSGKRISLREDPFGPPKALTRGDLRKLAKAMLDDPEKRQSLGLYGLDQKMLVKLLEREGVATFEPLWKWDNHALDDLSSTIWHTPFNKQHRGEAKTLVELTPIIRDELKACWESEITVRDQRRAARADAVRETKARSQQRLDEHFNDFLTLLSEGMGLSDAMDRFNLQRALLAGHVRKLFQTRTPDLYVPFGRDIAKHIQRGNWLLPAEEALLYLVCRSHPSREVGWRGIESAVYSEGTRGDRILALALELSNAAETVAATMDISEALKELQAAISASSTGGLYRWTATTES